MEPPESGIENEAVETLYNEDGIPLRGDSLQRLRAAVAGARTLKAEKADLEGRLKETNISIYKLETVELPDLFDEVGINSITLPPDGNLPGYKADAGPYYKANISADWDNDKRIESFQYLESIGFPDLIKTVITVPFNREMRGEAVKLLEELRSRGYNPLVTENVHPMTLTAWLKEQVEKRHFLPQLDKIGGIVGRIVKLKEQKNG
jgi:hypothetical protein